MMLSARKCQHYRKSNHAGFLLCERYYIPDNTTTDGSNLCDFRFITFMTRCIVVTAGLSFRNLVGGKSGVKEEEREGCAMSGTFSKIWKRNFVDKSINVLEVDDSSYTYDN